jgi:ATP-dependent helicase STH1/SNF2
MKKLQEEMANHPGSEDLDVESSVADGTSTRPMSAVGTPQPARSGIKLKLGNGGRANGNSSRGGTESAVQSDSD